MSEQPHMYRDLAGWFHILTQPADYEEEARIYTRVIHEMLPGARTMLELGCGGGNNASFLKHTFDMTLVDLSPSMLAISRRLNPELPHHQGDMRAFRLDRQFDVVFIHDAIMYMITEDDLAQAIRTAAVHTRPGGVALLAPDYMRETYRPSTSHGGHDGRDVVKSFPQPDPVMERRSLRYLEWSYDPDPSDTTCITEFAFLLKEEPGQVECVYDRHVNGIFPRDTWLRLMQSAGFQARLLPFDHSEVEPGQTEMVAGLKIE